AILRALGRDTEFIQVYPWESEIVRNIETLPTDWGIRSALTRSGLTSTLDFFEQLRTHWSAKFFSNDFWEHDQPYEGAIEFVRAAHAKGIQIRYLTGRDRPRMGSGT